MVTLNNDINFRIIETERKILDILNTCGLPIIVTSMVINGIKESVDINKLQVVQEYNKKVNENGDNTESNNSTKDSNKGTI